MNVSATFYRIVVSDSFRQSSVYIHHDQGSQYLSTSFQQLLNDGGFIQSVSARGNSQDNSPMESFFGHLKRDILDLVARCSDFSTAKRVIDGYISDYNEKFYQYSLAGLTPHEFYLYATTGIYPLDSYFGVSAKEMMSIEKVVEIRKEFADEEAAKRKAAAAKKREERRLLEPKRIMDRDRAILLGKIEEWMHAAKTASMQVEHLRSILSKVEAAIGFYFSAARDIKEELKDPLKWRKYPELRILKELVKTTDKKIFVDTNISLETLRKISDKDHVMIMLADPQISVSRFFDRPDSEKQFLYQLLLKEKKPDAAIANFRACLEKVNSQENYNKFLNSGFSVLLKDESRSIEETTHVVEKYLKL